MCQKGLFKAIRYFGSQKALARAIGVKQQTVSHWINRDQKIPDDHAMRLFVELEGHIPLEELVFSAPRIIQLLEKINLFLKHPAVSVPISSVQVNDCICPKYADEDLASIDSNSLFLSLPLLVDSNYQLMTCICRLHAQQRLGKRNILVHPICLSDVIRGKCSLRSLLSTFPISEKVAIGLAIERILGNRQGKRKDLSLLDTYPEVMKGTKTREIAAMLAGFNSDFLYRQAKVVLQDGSPALIRAMDETVCSISQARKIASLPKPQQHFLLTNLRVLVPKKYLAFQLEETVL